MKITHASVSVVDDRTVATVAVQLEDDSENIREVIEKMRLAFGGEPEKEDKPSRQRRGTKDKDEEKSEGNGRRRRRSSGPTKADVAKVASEAAEKLGTKLTAEIVADYAESGKIEDVPEDKREAFIKELNYNMEDD